MKADDLIKMSSYLGNRRNTTKLFLIVLTLFILFCIIIPGYLLIVLFLPELQANLSIGKLLLLSSSITLPFAFLNLIVVFKMLQFSQKGFSHLIRKMLQPAILAILTVASPYVALPLYGSIILGFFLGPKKWILVLSFILWIVAVKLSNFPKMNSIESNQA